jgi:aspartate/methionine/tyrosine aminotransferase
MVQHIRSCSSIHEIITTYVHQRLEDAGVRCPKPQGAFYLFPDWNSHREELARLGIISSHQLAKRLLTGHNLATLPGSAFGMASEDLCLRLASVDYDGATVLDQFIKRESKDAIDRNEFVSVSAPRIEQACDILERFTIEIKRG